MTAADNSTPGYHLKTYNPGESIALSDVLPILENFGLRVISEKPVFHRAALCPKSASASAILKLCR